MRARLAGAAGAVVVTVALAACGSGNGSPQAGRAPTSTSGSTSTTTTSPSSTTPSTVADLTAALTAAASAEGEALATYQAVIAELGTVSPFSNVASSEQQHLTALQTVAGRYGLTVPSGPFGAAAVPATKATACRLGVTIEQGVVSMYDQLGGQVAGYPDVAHVFATLQHAAEDDHLPAFERCA